MSEKLATVGEDLPDNVGNPTLGPQSSILGELLIVGLTADSTSMLDLRTLADWTIRPRLLSTGGVAQVAVLGGDIKEYQVLLHPERMKHYGVTLGEVMEVTRGMNQNTNGGVIYEYGNEYIVRGVVSTEEVQEMARAVIKTVGGAPVTLEDIADVRIGAQQPKLGTASEKGKPAVLITVTKQPHTGTIELTERLEAALHDLQKNLPPDVRVSTDTFRQSRFIENSIGNVQDSLVEGAIFVVIVLFLFLANVRTTLISLVTLPLSLVVAVLVLHYMGLSINTMSLGGMAIAIGSLVDDAIVDVENVWKHLRENRMLPVGERRGAYAYFELYFDYYRELRPLVLPERDGRQDVSAVRHRLHRVALCLYGGGVDPYSRVVQLSVRRFEERRPASRSLSCRMAPQALRERIAVGVGTQADSRGEHARPLPRGIGMLLYVGA